MTTEAIEKIKNTATASLAESESDLLELSRNPPDDSDLLREALAEHMRHRCDLLKLIAELCDALLER